MFNEKTHIENIKKLGYTILYLIFPFLKLHYFHKW